MKQRPIENMYDAWLEAARLAREHAWGYRKGTAHPMLSPEVREAIARRTFQRGYGYLDRARQCRDGESVVM
jgi:hypothetical protein